MSTKQLEILHHSLGLKSNGKGRQYRNHFVTGPGSDDYEACTALVEAGLMKRHPPSVLTGGDEFFTVTEEGMRFVCDNATKGTT